MDSQFLYTKPYAWILTCGLLYLFLEGFNQPPDHVVFSTDHNIISVQDSLSVEPTPFMPELFSVKGKYNFLLHSSLIFSPDGNVVFFTVQDTVTFRKTIYSVAKSDDIWGEPSIVSFSGEYNDETGWFSRDGNRFYFYSNRPVRNDTEQPGEEGLWIAERREGSWHKTYPVRSPSDLRFNDGTIYVSAELEGGYGGYDMYSLDCHNGHYGMPINLGPAVNSNYDEYFQCIHEDKGFLISYHFHPVDKEIRGLYISFLDAEFNWSLPKPLSEELGLSGGFRATISPFGKFLFILNRKDGIYWIPVEDLLNLIGIMNE